MGIGRTIGRWFGQRTKQQQRESLKEQLRSFDLSDEEIKEVEPYLEYITERKGRHKVAGILIAVLLVVGVVVAVAADFLFFMVIIGFFALLLLILLLSAYRNHRKAIKVEQALLANPEKFVEDEPHEFHHIKN